MTNWPDPVTHFDARVIGSTAHQWLASSFRRGKVLAVVTNCIYLVDSDDQLVWLANESAFLHPRSIQLAGALPGLDPGVRFRIERQELVFQTGVLVNTANAEGWHPPECSSTRLPGFPEIYRRSWEVYTLLAGLQPRGFGSFIAPILASAQPDEVSSQPQFSDPVLLFAWPLVQAIARAAACQDLRNILARVNDLIGLGNGLTPSGDDFLGGLFFGLHTLNRLFPALLNLDSGEVSRVRAQAGLRTNLISATLLGDLAAGLGPAPLHAFMRCLLLPQGPAAVINHALAVSSIGHSTGWDELAGLLVGLLWTCPEAERVTRVGIPCWEWVETVALRKE